jgi:hypothetical protein
MTMRGLRELPSSAELKNGETVALRQRGYGTLRGRMPSVRDTKLAGASWQF